MKVQPSQLKPTAQIAVAVMVILLTGAFIFYKERMLFIDAPHICFRLLNYKTFVIEEHRYGSFITQMVPLIGERLHWSLKTILVAYSASFNLFYLIVALLVVFRCKQYGMAILMALYYTLFVSDAYYWTNNEVHQGTAWMFLFFAVAFYNASRRRPIILQLIPFLLLGSLAVFTHPLVMISAIFLWGYLLLNKDQWPYTGMQTILYSILLLAIIAIKFYMSQEAGYDSGKMEQAMHVNLRGIWMAIKSPMTKTFLHDCITNYWLVPLITLAGMVALIRQKKWLPLCWTLLMAAVFVILMGLTYGNSEYDRHTRFYMESEWMSLSIIVAAPFVFNFLPGLKWPAGSIFLVIIFIVRLIYIGISAQVFTDRIVFIEQSLKQMRKKNLTKVVLIKQNSLIDDKLLMDWGLPDESLFASILDGDKPALTYCELPPEQLGKGVPKDRTTMIACFQLVNDKL
ncbi:MAG: hypothetical protein ACTHJ0_04300, partial [Flavipsychrobacter sp.]